MQDLKQKIKLQKQREADLKRRQEEMAERKRKEEYEQMKKDRDEAYKIYLEQIARQAEEKKRL